MTEYEIESSGFRISVLQSVDTLLALDGLDEQHQIHLVSTIIDGRDAGQRIQTRYDHRHFHRPSATSR